MSVEKNGRAGRLLPLNETKPMQPMQGSAVPLTYFRPRRPGPELVIEDYVAAGTPELFIGSGRKRWMAASLPIGSGMPDLLIVSYDPIAHVLADSDISDANILGYLRAVRNARADTIALRLQASIGKTEKRLLRLLDARAIEVTTGDAFSITAAFRDVLPEIIAIEVKVDNWRRAIQQARRNRLFSHRSFVALPVARATRVQDEAGMHRFGLGLIAVDDAGGVSVMRPAKVSRPKIWTYYYQIASLVARSNPN